MTLLCIVEHVGDMGASWFIPSPMGNDVTEMTLLCIVEHVGNMGASWFIPSPMGNDVTR